MSKEIELHENAREDIRIDLLCEDVIALTEHLRLKEGECKQLQQDKAGLVEALKAVAIQFDFDTNNEYEYLIIKEAKALLEKHKCD